jgi:hypothetical protein
VLNLKTRGFFFFASPCVVMVWCRGTGISSFCTLLNYLITFFIYFDQKTHR